MRREPFRYGECSQKQMTVGELRKVLKEYPNDTRIFVESENTITNQGNTLWAQKVLDSYCCEEKIKHRNALMLVGSVR